MSLTSDWNIDRSWTLFLDRDGVINQKLPNDYVKRWDEFTFLPGVLEALSAFNSHFGRIVIVTNQQGIGKGLMTTADLETIHARMLSEVEQAGGRIDRFYHCPHLVAENARCRKPDIGMAEQAKEDFPQIDWTRSVLIGDSESDMEMARRCGMKRVFLARESSRLPLGKEWGVDRSFVLLSEVAEAL